MEVREVFLVGLAALLMGLLGNDCLWRLQIK